MPIDITNKEEKQIALTGAEIEETLLQAHLSKDAIEKLEGLQASASEIDDTVKNYTTTSFLIGGEVQGDNGNLLDAARWQLFIAGSGTPTIQNGSFSKFNTSSLGVGNINVGANSINGYKTSFTKSEDYSSIDFFTLWIYVDEQLVIDGVAGNAYGDHMFVVGDNSGGHIGARIEALHKGWNNKTVLKSDFKIVISGTIDWSDVKFFQIRIATNASNDGKLIYINSIIAGGHTLDKVPVCITMDDGGFESKEMAEIMNSYGIPTSLFVINEFVDNYEAHPGYFSLDDCNYLYKRGNHIGIHGSVVSEFVVNKEKIKVASDWLKSNGFTRDNGHLYGTYPNGSTNQTTIDYAKSIGIKALRTIMVKNRDDANNIEGYFHSNGVVPLLNGGIADSFRIAGAKPINLTTFKTDLDLAIHRQSAYITYHHVYSEFVNKAEWIALAKYLKSKVDDGSIECLTFPQFCKKYSN